MNGAVNRGDGEAVVAHEPARKVHDSRTGLVLRATVSYQQQWALKVGMVGSLLRACGLQDERRGAAALPPPKRKKPDHTCGRAWKAG